MMEFLATNFNLPTIIVGAIAVCIVELMPRALRSE